MPMSDFDDDGGKSAGASAEPELEDLDSVLGDGGDKPRRSRGGRRPRRRD